MSTNLRHGLLMFVFAILFANCNKWRDKWYQEYHDKVPDVANFCRLTEIHQIAAPSFETRVGKFYYGTNGNLDSLVFSDDIVYYWKYDEASQLVEFRESTDHNKNHYLTLHTYASANGRIVRDTSRRPGASAIITEVWTLQYDNFGRVIRETGYRIDDEAPGAGLPEKSYNYDTNGNLVSSQYERDNEINYLRTNKVLQFVHRDYSKNNFKKNLLGYNQYHLPVAFLQSGQSFLRGEAPSKLIYSCIPTPGFPGSKQECHIDSVRQSWQYGLTTAAFYYTPDGRPLSIYYKDYVNPFGPELHSFVYNKHGKLLGYNIDVGYPMVTHRYGYHLEGITSDTMYSERPEQEQFEQISNFVYDNRGRITEEKIHVVSRNFTPVSEHFTKTFNYDSQGNLVSPLVIEYDNKVNYLRTDPVWMFIHRNYSKNNPKTANLYNSNNLPLGFSKETFGFFAFGDPVEISYTCGRSRK